LLDGWTPQRASYLRRDRKLANSPVAKFFFEGDRKLFRQRRHVGPFKRTPKGKNYLGRPEQVDVDLAILRKPD
jgi:hypothetical protein